MIDTTSDRFVWNGSAWALSPSTSPQNEYGDWSASSPISVRSNGSAPAKSTSPLADSVRYRYVGYGRYEVEYRYAHNVIAGTAGTALYDFFLPNDFRWDPAFHPQTAATANSGVANFAMAGATATAIEWGVNHGRCLVVPYSNVTFRLWAYLDTTGNRPFVGASGFGLGASHVAYNVSFIFKAI